ncbi:uncharacterized protein LOC122370648 [Amphibalanus amphitrite]|nr:uncharacterized protein LOC122370648 [Amphibalanus amphitrite]
MPSEAVATVGGHMAVQCHVRGQPTPRAIWWRETEFEPLLADQERGRLSTSVQHELYIAPVTADDLGWWVCGATNAAGSVTGRVLLADSERPPRRRGAPAPEVTERSDLDRDLVHLAELQVVRPDSVRITWKVSNTSPVDGFYICLISGSVAGRGGDGTGAPGRVVRGAPVLPGRPGPVLQRVPVLNGGADSYVLTRLSAGRAYEVFLVPFRQGLEGRLSNLQHVQMPETAPSAAPNDLQLSTDGDSTLITWSGLADSDTNGVVRGYSVLVLSADPTSGRPQQRLFNTSAPFARLAGQPDLLRVRVAAFTAAGVGPYSAWVGPVQGWPTSAPPPATAAVPFGGPPGGGSAPPAALVAALGALCLAALGAALLTLHCRRLRAKQQRLDMAATMYADVKLPVIAREPRPDVLTRNTLWLRDDLFLTSLGNAQRSAQSRERRDELQNKPHDQLGDVSLKGLAEGGPEAAQTKLGQECHIYVNELPCSSGPSSKEVLRVRRAPSRGRESVELMTSGQIMTSGLESETESELERLTRRVRSLRPRAGRSLSSDGTSGPSVPSRASRPSLRLRHDRRGRAPHSPQLSGGTYQECCCYECDYQPPPLPPDSSYDSSSSDFTTLPDLMTRSAPVRSAQFQPPHPLAPPAADRVAHSFPAGAKDGATLATLGVNPSRRASSDDVGSASDSGSSLYAETELNDAPRHNAESDVSSDVTSSQHKLSISKPPISSNSDAENNSSETTQTFICAPGDSLENCDLPKSPIDVGSGESLRSLNNGCTDQYSP